MFGESRATLAKKRLTKYIVKEDQDTYYAYRKDLFESMQPLECELRMVTADASMFWGHMKSSIVSEGGVHICRMVISDISTRKTAEQKSKASEEKHRQLITQMSQGLVVLEAIQDHTGKVIDYFFVDLNEAFEQLTGLKREALIGKHLLEVMPQIEPSWLQKYEQVAMTDRKSVV